MHVLAKLDKYILGIEKEMNARRRAGIATGGGSAWMDYDLRDVRDIVSTMILALEEAEKGLLSASNARRPTAKFREDQHLRLIEVREALALVEENE